MSTRRSATSRQMISPRLRTNIASAGMDADGTESTFAPAWTAVVVFLIWLQPMATSLGFPPVGSLALAISALHYALAVGVERERVRSKPFPILVCLAGFSWSLIGIGVSELPWTRAIEWISLALILAIAPSFFSSVANRRAIVATSAASLTLWIGAVAAQVYLSPSLFGLTRTYDDGRVTGLHYNANGGALFILCGVLLLLPIAFAPKAPWRIRVPWLLLVCGGSWGVVQTGSRAALVSVVAGIGALLVLRLTLRLSNRFYSQLVLILLGAIVVIRYLPQWVSSLTGREGGFSLVADRGEIWSAAIDLIWQNFWFGVGDISFGVSDNSHNALLEACLQFGVPGAALLLLLVLYFSFRAWGQDYSTPESLLPKFALVMLVGIAAYGITHVAFIDNSYAWLVIAGSVGVHSQNREP